MINIRAKKITILLVAVAALAALPVYAQQGSTKRGEGVKEKISALSADAESRAAAACSLGQIGTPALEAIPYLVEMLGDDTPVDRVNCWKTGQWSPSMETLKSPSPGEMAAKALAAMGKPSVAPLIDALKSSNPSVRRNAAWALGEIRGGLNVDRSSAVGPLIAALEDSDLWVRKTAAWSLGEIRDRRAVTPLIALLKDDDAKARREAARSLGEIKDRRAVDHLIDALKDNDSNVVLAVSWALGEIQGSQPWKR